VFSDVLKDHLGKQESVRVIQGLEPPAEPKLKPSVAMGAGLAETSASPAKKETKYFQFPAQYLIRGNLINFQPALKSENPSDSETADERALLEVEVRLENSGNGTIVFSKKWKAENSEGRKPFKAGYSGKVWDDPEFRMSSAGGAMNALGKSVARWIDEKLEGLPVNVHVIGAGPVNGTILINAGSNDGVEVSDFFKVYAVTPNFTDPVTGAVLGDAFERLGAVKVDSVQEHFSSATILAGNDFTVGHLARHEERKSLLRAVRPMSDSGGKMEKVIPWWDFYGALALPKR
jgi:hypothetical protein